MKASLSPLIRLFRPQRAGRDEVPADWFGQLVMQTRPVLALAVLTVLLVAVILFVAGAILSLVGVWHAIVAIVRGEMGAKTLTVEFLEIVSVMLKAVVFYIIAVGLYRLLIVPHNLITALGVDSLNDLERRVVSMIVVIMAVTFLDRFTLGGDPIAILLFAAALAMSVAVLVLYQLYLHREEMYEHPHAASGDAPRPAPVPATRHGRRPARRVSRQPRDRREPGNTSQSQRDMQL